MSTVNCVTDEGAGSKKFRFSLTPNKKDSNSMFINVRPAVSLIVNTNFNVTNQETPRAPWSFVHPPSTSPIVSDDKKSKKVSMPANKISDVILDMVRTSSNPNVVALMTRKDLSYEVSFRAERQTFACTNNSKCGCQDSWFCCHKFNHLNMFDEKEGCLYLVPYKSIEQPTPEGNINIKLMGKSDCFYLYVKNNIAELQVNLSSIYGGKIIEEEEFDSSLVRLMSAEQFNEILNQVPTQDIYDEYQTDLFDLIEGVETNEHIIQTPIGTKNIYMTQQSTDNNEEIEESDFQPQPTKVEKRKARQASQPPAVKKIRMKKQTESNTITDLLDTL